MLLPRAARTQCDNRADIRRSRSLSLQQRAAPFTTNRRCPRFCLQMTLAAETRRDRAWSRRRLLEPEVDLSGRETQGRAALPDLLRHLVQQGGPIVGQHGVAPAAGPKIAHPLCTWQVILLRQAPETL